MQIILIQSEIEQAIKDFISKRLTVAENTDIQIDLSATRGAEGIKAIIDLVPATTLSAANSPKKPKPISIGDAPKEKESAVAKLQASQTKTPTIVVVSGEPAVEAEAAPAAAETAQDESEVVEVAEDSTEAAEAAETVEEGQNEVQAEEVAAAPATPPVRSLFANLRKPVNNPA